MKAKQTLYDIGDDLWAIEALLEEDDGDITECEVTIDEWLLEAQDNLTDKLTGYRKLIAHLDGYAEAAETEAKRIQAIAKVRRNSIDRLKTRLYQFLTAHNIDKVETPVGTFAIQKNGGKRTVSLTPHLEEHAEELPEGFHRAVFEADKDAIRDKITAIEAEAVASADALFDDESDRGGDEWLAKYRELRSALIADAGLEGTDLLPRGTHLRIK